LVPTSGVEPPWGCPHLILSQARLPFRHVGTGSRFTSESAENAEKNRNTVRVQSITLAAMVVNAGRV
jgi:hypothetical protein